MNRRHFLLTGAALATLAASGFSAVTGTPATASIFATQPAGLVGYDLHHLEDVIHGAVDLPNVAAIRLTREDFQRISSREWLEGCATPLTCGRPFALHTPAEQAQMLMEQRAMLDHLLDQGYIQLRDALPQPQPVDVASHKAAWYDAVDATVPRWLRA